MRTKRAPHVHARRFLLTILLGAAAAVRGSDAPSLRITTPTTAASMETASPVLTLAGTSTAYLLLEPQVQVELSGATVRPPSASTHCYVDVRTGAWSCPGALSLQPGRTLVTVTLVGRSIFGATVRTRDTLTVSYIIPQPVPPPPAIPGTPEAENPPVLSLSTTGATGTGGVFQAGDTLRLYVSVHGTGGAWYDVYLALILPSGEILWAFGNGGFQSSNVPIPLVRNWISTEVASAAVVTASLNGGIPAGRYQWRLMLAPFGEAPQTAAASATTTWNFLPVAGRR